ncbi:MAG: methyltransferase domain-containing protein [alpha proteobacterium HIMB59]|nr:MAG: methyltransferase domain-containing protein [alpha proteobacterium HIMB59]|tara:strand:- start:2682 stop:3392 length:711 start_codon:yes stop_codon:yes gene_type:complete
MKYNCTNWDKNSWLSSDIYFNDLNDLLITKLKIDDKCKILDIGCGRGYLLNNLSTKINFKKKLYGVEPVKHKKNTNKKISIFNKSIQEFLKENTNNYNIIIMKQVLHLIPSDEREALLHELKKIIPVDGKLVIMQMNEKFQLPCFPAMKKLLTKTLSHHQIIENELKNLFNIIQKEEYSFKVNLPRSTYIGMIEDKFISVLDYLSKEEIKEGCEYIQSRYPSNISFIDKLKINIFG